jgi:hypothetical protein
MNYDLLFITYSDLFSIQLYIHYKMRSIPHPDHMDNNDYDHTNHFDNHLSSFGTFLCNRCNNELQHLQS